MRQHGDDVREQWQQGPPSPLFILLGSALRPGIQQSRGVSRWGEARAPPMALRFLLVRASPNRALGVHDVRVVRGDGMGMRVTCDERRAASARRLCLVRSWVPEPEQVLGESDPAKPSRKLGLKHHRSIICVVYGRAYAPQSALGRQSRHRVCCACLRFLFYFSGHSAQSRRAQNIKNNLVCALSVLHRACAGR